MNEHYLRYKLSHLLVRVIAGVNLIEVGLELAYPAYGHALGNGTLTKLVGGWLVSTSIALPIFVVLESKWIQEAGGRKAVLIDATFAVAWFLVFWISVLYAFTHHALWL